MDTSVCTMICSKWNMSVESVIRNEEESYIAVLKGEEKRLLKLSVYGDTDNEVRVMRSVPSSVPIPKVYDHGKENEIRYLLMEYIEDSIPMSDLNRLPPPHLMKSIKKYIKAIRSVTMDYEHGSSHGLYLDVCGFDSLGYASADEFIQKRMEGLELPHDPSFKFKEDKLVLSHCDLWPRNVLVTKDGSKILSIIDWEMAGYYPSFYEHSAYLFAARSQDLYSDPFIRQWMKLFATPDTRRVKPYENRIYNAVVAGWKAARSEQTT
ncbi:0d8c6d34-b979-4252-9e80-509dbbc3e9e7 [Sclerotinia trifoliorum]|uniref:0d8c6d34-b979-4252-9e80-509dbbc3e9e7 n=1 Tax=Sclerotinia trifoliorum TaxID=28548 RepID=A0A8H2ZXW2_9HELO|nr:0d8c6d34-b979-4252-9e80-509dbbc3e9e7 [Sclerotinia trifoliorum]